MQLVLAGTVCIEIVMYTNAMLQCIFNSSFFLKLAIRIFSFLDFLYQEAFLTTYRTFISAKDLIDKLLYRYGHFSRMSDIKKKRLSRNAFALLIRVVDELW